MKKTFYSRYALTILVAVFFLLPFGLRGARMALQQMKNNVKDWLPESFSETKEMDWFWKHFIGERFIVASWEDCNEDDTSYKMFLQKLEAEVPPSKRAKTEEGSEPAAIDNETLPVEEEVAIATSGAHGHSLERPYDSIGDRLSLFSTGNDYLNRGGHNEKWLVGRKGQWY